MELREPRVRIEIGIGVEVYRFYTHTLSDLLSYSTFAKGCLKGGVKGS
mgnify:CR=1 FL=1